MNLTRITMLSVLIALMLGGAISQAPQRGTGLVYSASGQPLEGVWVQELGTWNGTRTKADAVFSFGLGKPETLLLAKDGFQPRIVTTSGTERPGELRVIMEPSHEASLSIGSCKRQWPGPLRELEIRRAAQLRVTRGGDVDFRGYSATYVKDRTPFSLSSMTGMHVSGLTPTPDWVAGLSGLSVRSIKCGGFEWIDLRGVSALGLESRWVGYSFGHLEYSKVPGNAARVFDAAIDNGCCR